MKVRRLVKLAVGLLLVAAACGESANASGPPDIKYGRDVCVECNMIITEPRHAAAYRLPDGTEKLFDDVGGMVKHGREQDEFDAATAWVHDYETEEWVAVQDAFFIPTRSVATPMGHGILAFSDRGRADTFAAAVDGEVIDWSTVLELPVVDGLVGHQHEDHEEETE